jgi:putative ABC transport system permease protein
VTLTTAGGTAKLELEGTFEGNEITGEWIVSTDTFDRIQPPNLRGNGFVLANVDEGADPGAVVKRIDKALGKDAKLIDVQDNEGLRQQAEDQFGFIIGVVMAMLFLSLVIALFGIANTLALNVFERTREIGLIRAVGGTRRQVRRMIRVEAVLIALFGAIVGVALGVGAGAALVSALADEGFVFGLSVVPLVVVLVGGFVAGLLASILPARRAARMDVLEAIATE